MVVCPELLKDIKIQDKNNNQFKIRKLTIGPDFADLVRLEKPPQNPFKKSKEKLNKEDQLIENAQFEHEFQNFIPDFSSLQKIINKASVKTNGIVYPVISHRKKSQGCKMIIQMNIPRKKLFSEDSRPEDSPNRFSRQSIH